MEYVIEGVTGQLGKWLVTIQETQSHEDNKGTKELLENLRGEILRERNKNEEDLRFVKLRVRGKGRGKNNLYYEGIAYGLALASSFVEREIETLKEKESD